MAVVKTALVPQVIFPLLSMVHTTAVAEFLMVKGFDVSGVSITKGDVLSSLERTATYFVSPFDVVDKLIYSGPAEKSVTTRKLPVNLLS